MVKERLKLTLEELFYNLSDEYGEKFNWRLIPLTQSGRGIFIDELKNVIIDASLIEHKKDEFDNLFNLIKDYPNLIVVMESTSVYHLPVETYFRSKCVDTVVINPKLVRQFKDTLNKSKTDKLDCFKIARCYLGTIDNFYQKQDEYFMYSPLARQYWSLIEGQTRLKNRYKQLIEIIFPEFNLIFNDLYDDLALNFIHDFPHPVLFVNRRIDYLMNYLKEKNGTTQAYRFKNKVLKMKELTNNSLCFVFSIALSNIKSIAGNTVTTETTPKNTPFAITIPISSPSVRLIKHSAIKPKNVVDAPPISAVNE